MMQDRGDKPTASHYERAQRFTFRNQTHPSWVVGERVVVFAPLPPLQRSVPPISQFRSLTLEQYLQHEQTQLIRVVEQLFLELMTKYGPDCDHFEITLDPKGRPDGVIFTRPMDRVEILQIRDWRSRNNPPPGRPPQPPSAPKAQDRLPDPATVRPLRD
jgi:hypothetical protein